MRRRPSPPIVPVKMPARVALQRLGNLAADIQNSIRLIGALQKQHPHLVVSIDVERPRLRLLGSDEAA